MIDYTFIVCCRTSLLSLIFILLFFGLAVPIQADSSMVTFEEVPSIRPETTNGLQAFFQALDYNWAELEEGVPPLILENIPDDINRTASARAKKHAFFMGLLPMILLANQEIEKEREYVQYILSRHSSNEIQDGDLERLDEILRRYGLLGHPFTDHRVRSRLMRRVDIIPPSLVLAQAANESAWGSSRFARMGNNLFGEWTYKPGTGLIPAGRPEGATYEVRKFSSIYESIRSYMNNLNRNGAYRKLRQIREQLRESNQPVTGMALAKGLTKYSQRGDEYISEIQAMIRQNQLMRVNDASLRLPETDTQTIIGTSGSGLFSSRNRMIGHRSPARQDP